VNLITLVRPAARLSLSVPVLLGATLLALAPARAQYDGSADAQGGGFQGSEVDAFGEGIDGIDPIELMHRARFNRGRSLQEFSSDQQRNLEDASSNFRRQQQERLQPSPEGAEPVPEL